MNFDVGSLATVLGAGLLLFLGCALPFGVFVPGGSTLVLVLGALAARNDVLEMELWLVLASAQTLGQWVGFFWGRRLGSLLEKRIPPALIERIRPFLRRYGRWAVLLAPWFPVVRNVTPYLLGAEEAPAGPYLFYSALAAWLWVGGLLIFARLARVWIEALFGV